ncbi:uncharacterized protein LOC7471154 isoform X2 [Populus trichocarpa]|uniref:uncharacterized protein LOC7471154 isoform X2 n=1 Tax=Populus trichocarpa TaxID=3694 RepID=UPI002279085E|nr:uncharacterized protein LOC7471154 isoform X2 [Populus trichocarpa]
MESLQELSVLEANKRLLKELEDMGFPRIQAAKALHCSGNTDIEAAINWIVDHENEPSIDPMPLIAVNIDIDSPQPIQTTEEMQIKAQELRNQARKEKEDEEKRLEREREKNERRRMLGLPSVSHTATKLSSPSTHDKKNYVSVASVSKVEQLRECLRSLKRSHKDDDARVKRAFQTLLVYVGNVAQNPDKEKFRKIRIGNPLFQSRVGRLRGGVEFLELCGFERIEEDKFLFLPRDKVDLAVLNSAGLEIKSAMSNPFFGLLSNP